MSSYTQTALDSTGYENGEQFASEAEVREYFTVANMVDMFGPEDGGTLAQDELDAMAADVIANRFQILECAGAGGMGEVYRALDEATGQPVAIKIVTSRHKGDAVRFAREARILADLTHPQIVRYLADGALPTGEPYIAMEWLDGEDLSVRLARGRLSVAESMTLASAVAPA